MNKIQNPVTGFAKLSDVKKIINKIESKAMSDDVEFHIVWTGIDYRITWRYINNNDCTEYCSGFADDM